MSDDQMIPSSVIRAARQRLDEHDSGSDPLANLNRAGLNGDEPQDDTGDDALAVLRLPAEFWSERPALGHIHAAALSRMTPPDAVLASVLCRIAAYTSHTVELPPNVGGAVGLSLIAALVGPPAAGKSSAMATARDLIPRGIATGYDVADGLPIGSGEGMAEIMYGTVTEEVNGKRQKGERRQVRHNALFEVDEGTLLGELADRKGTTTLTTLRSIFTHGTIGATNASSERQRTLNGADYVYGIVVGLQPDLAGPLFKAEVVGAGTPQRFLWLWCIDPTLSPDLSDWPGPLDWTPPGPGDLAPLKLVGAHGKVRHRLAVPDAIAAEVRRSIHNGRTQADTDPLDRHQELARLKVAALFGILDGRLEVSADDWRLAGVVVATSHNVRHYVAGTLRAVKANEERASTERLIRREEANEDAAVARALGSAARSIGRKVHANGPAKRSVLSLAMAGKHRQLVSVDDVIAEAVAQGFIVKKGDAWVPGRCKP